MTLGVVDSDYDKFKTPFFEVKIGNAAGKNMQELPSSIAKLIEKIEITETIAGCEITSQFNIVFKEGSREPFSKINGGSTKSLYSDSDITNSTGMLTDLRFVSKSGTGFTSIIPSAIGKALTSIKSLTGKVSGITGLNSSNSSTIVEENNVISDETVQLSDVIYLFQQRNQIEVTWGYLEDAQNKRIIRGIIQVLQSNFPEAGHPSTTVSCMGPGSWLDQLTPLNAMYFREQSLVTIDPEVGPVYTFTDLTVEESIRKVVGPGFKVIVSPNIINQTVDKYHTKVLPAGKSIDQFLRGMKKSNNAFYISYYSPKTGQPVIAYISRNDFMKKEIITNRTLFTYKAPGAIIKTVDIRADFNGVTGAAHYAIGSDGSVKTVSTNNGSSTETLFKNRSLVDNNPKTGNHIPEAQQISDNFGNGNSLVGKITMSPQGDDTNTLADSAKANAVCMNKLVFLEFTSLGYTKLTPGMCYFGGIGNRYSGQYEVISVTHSIDNNGYSCKGSAQAATLDGASGVKPKQAQEAQDSTVTEQLFEPKTAFNISSPNQVGAGKSPLSTSSTNAMDDYLKDILG